MATNYDDHTGDVLLDEQQIARFHLLENEFEELEITLDPVGSHSGRTELEAALAAKSSPRPPREDFKVDLRFDNGELAPGCWISGFRAFHGGRQYFLVRRVIVQEVA